MNDMSQQTQLFTTKLGITYAEFFDGIRPAIQRVSVTVEGSGPDAVLELKQADTDETLRWHAVDLRLVPDQARDDDFIFANGDDNPARLIIRDYDALKEIFTAIPHVRAVRGHSSFPRLMAMMGGAMIAFAAILFGLIPFMADRGAEMIPPTAEAQMGASVFEQIYPAMGAYECTDPAGQAALDRMEARLTRDLDLPYPITARVVTEPSINATALPGGHVTFHLGLIEVAESPEEVAAVFAHEIGHVAHPDGTRAVLRSMGSFGVIGLVYGDFLGASAMAAVSQQLLNSSYSRAAEERADAYAQDLLVASGISPAALTVFFERLQNSGDVAELGIFQHFSTHPELADRIAASAAAVGPAVAGPPILTAEEWAALQNICQENATPTASTQPGFTPSAAPSKG